MAEYIYEIKNNLHPDVCKRIIEKFEQDENKAPGKVVANPRTNEYAINPDIKVSMDLAINPNCKEWMDIDRHLFERLADGKDKYLNYMKKMWDEASNFVIDDKISKGFVSFNYDSGYQIQRISKGGHYIYHNDYAPHQKRTIAYIWYLNTLNQEDGGTTDFLTQNVKIKPEEGKLIFFPATWTYIHKGSEVITDSTKYIITGFLIYD